jgi:long-chain acyl-CoA synthetase
MARVLDLGEDEMTLHVCPFFHIAAVWMILIHLSRGCTNVILPKFEPEAVYQALSRYPITNLNIVPTMLFDLVRAGGAADYRQRTLRLILYGAAPMPDATFRKGTEVFGSVFAQIYGLTEASPVLTWLPKEDHALEGPLAARLRSCGRAVPGVEVAVVDELGRSLGPGEVGEIVARGATVFPGYWKNPDATSAAIHNGWLRTGDLARRDEEGYIYLVDRKKDMIISGGENIYCREIEAVLERHPVVEEVAVVGLRDERWGEVPQAWIVPSDEPLPLAEELQSWCDARLARFKVPKSFRFVSSLPKGPSGKVLKKEIRSWQQAESA